jgi:DNA gyrase subunit B
MNPVNRILLQDPVDDTAEADHTFDMVMGNTVDPHKKFITTHSKNVRILDI